VWWKDPSIVFGVSALAGLMVLSVYLFHRDMSGYEVNHYRVPMGTKFGGDPLRLIHVTDLHMGPWVLPSRLQKIAGWINRRKPDYVVITGDFISHFREYVPGCARALSVLSPRLGTLAVLGNHDHWVDGDYISGVLKDEGIIFLKNENIPCEDQQGLYIAGVDDLYTGHCDLNTALKGIPEGATILLLTHSPDLFYQAAERGVRLILAGHTHGGQVCLPFYGPLSIPSKYGTRLARGWFNAGDTRLYVNRGVGEVFPPVRAFCRREIVVMDLVAGTGEAELVRREYIML